VRELAIQVEESVRTYGKHLPVNSLAVFGGVGINPQIASLRRGVDVLVATPGRLLDHVQQRTVDLSAIEILVLDEADRMLDMGFIRDIRKIIALLPKQRQNLMFSATFSPDIRELASGLLHQPVSVDVAPRNTAAETVTQRVIETNREQKKDLLLHLFETRGLHQVLIFTRTKHGADALSRSLEKAGIKSAALHGNKSQAPAPGRSANSRMASWWRWWRPTSRRADCRFRPGQDRRDQQRRVQHSGADGLHGAPVRNPCRPL
jgi:ATP-dependent RNA helicase RhlE